MAAGCSALLRPVPHPGLVGLRVQCPKIQRRGAVHPELEPGVSRKAECRLKQPECASVGPSQLKKFDRKACSFFLLSSEELFCGSKHS